MKAACPVAGWLKHPYLANYITNPPFYFDDNHSADEGKLLAKWTNLPSIVKGSGRYEGEEQKMKLWNVFVDAHVRRAVAWGGEVGAR